MSLDLTATLVFQDAPVGELLSKIEETVRGAGYLRTGGLTQCSFQAGLGVFDESGNSEEVWHFGSVRDVQEKIVDWAGVSVEFRHEVAGTFYLLIGRTLGEYSNAWIDYPERGFRRLVENNVLMTYYALVCGTARACNAVAGRISLETAFEPCSPSRLLNLVSPKNASQCDDVVVLRETNSVQLESFESAYGSASRIHRYPGGYWVIETPFFRKFWGL